MTGLQRDTATGTAAGAARWPVVAELAMFVSLYLWITLSLGWWWSFSFDASDGTAGYTHTRDVVPITAPLLLAAWLSLRARGLRWRDVGLRSTSGLGRRAAVYTVAAFGIGLIGTSIGDLGTYGPLRDNERLLVYYLYVSVWAGVAEELVFRGYLLHRIADLTGRGRTGWALAAAGSAVLFGVAHLYLGIAGAVSPALGALLATVLYLTVFRRNLWPLIAVHLIVDAVMFLLLYLGVLS